MVKLRAFIDNLKIKHKLILVYCLFFLVPLVIVFSIFIYWLYNSLLGWQLTQSRKTMEQTELYMQNVMRETNDVSNTIYINKKVQDVVSGNYDGVLSIYAAYDDIKFINDFLNAYKFISSIRLYVDNQQLLDNSFIVKTDSTVKNEPWYKKALLLNGQAFWIYKKDTINHHYYLSYVRSIWSVYDRSYIGVLCININPETIKKELDSQMYDTNINYQGELLYTTLSDINALYINNISIENHGFAKVQMDKTKYGMITDSFECSSNLGTTLDIVSLFPMTELNKSVLNIINICIGILVLFVLLSFLMILYFSGSFTARVNKIRKAIHNVVSNNFEIESSIGGKDEFADIYNALYEMSVNIKNLINQVYIRNIEKQKLLANQNDIRFKMLASQINPHFLFNTIEHIRMKSLDTGDKDIPYMLKLMAKILRYNLSVKQSTVSIMQEIEVVNDYLEIQHKRFGSRVSYDIVLLSDVRNIKILPLLIQPIVENSYSHGLESTTAGGFIYILIDEVNEAKGKVIKIVIEDNGSGMNQETLEELKNKIDTTRPEELSSSIGLVNVNQRIKLYYGADYGLNIESRINEGTKVTISIPVEETEHVESINCR